jgi:polyisoprenoid-binding protein YceI
MILLLRKLLPIVVSAVALSAAPAVVHLDPAKTTIAYTLTDVLHTVHGTFRLKSGEIQFDPDKRTIAGRLVVDAASGDSGSSARDSRMKKTYLEVERYPEITFTPASIDRAPSADGSTVIVAGTFTLHGESHALSIPMQVKIAGGQVSASGSFVVPYVAWGVKNPSNLFLKVSDKVDVSVSASASIQ